MAKPVGGRGIKAPYETTHMRIPIPLKEQIEVIVEDYKEQVTKNINLLTSYQISSNSNPLTSLEDAKQIAKKLVKSKKSASQSLAKLLSELYQVEVKVEDLRE